MSDNNSTYKFSRVSFGLDNARALKVLLKEFNSSTTAQNQLGTKGNMATLHLIEINDALLDNPDLISDFSNDIEFHLILVNAQRFLIADREFCAQCFLFFNLIKQDDEDSKIMLQSLPMFLYYMEKYSETADVFFALLEIIAKSENNHGLFLQVVIRNQAFLKYVDQILNLGDTNSVALLGFLINVINLPNIEIVLRTLAPTIYRLGENKDNYEISKLARQLGKILKTSVEQERIKQMEREKEEAEQKLKVVEDEKRKKQKEAEEKRSELGCLCGCGEMDKCLYQKEIYPKTCFIAPDIPDSSSIATGLFGRVTGQFGFLYINHTISTGIWHCTIKFVENKGFCRVGICETNPKNYIGNLDGEGALAFDNMGNYVQPGADTVSSKKGWKKDALVTLEIDTNKRQLCTYVADRLQPIVFINIPKIVRVYTWNVNPSLVQIIKFCQVASSAGHTEQTRVFDWERKSQ